MTMQHRPSGRHTQAQRCTRHRRFRAYMAATHLCRCAHKHPPHKRRCDSSDASSLNKCRHQTRCTPPRPQKTAPRTQCLRFPECMSVARRYPNSHMRPQNTQKSSRCATESPSEHRYPTGSHRRSRPPQRSRHMKPPRSDAYTLASPDSQLLRISDPRRRHIASRFDVARPLPRRHRRGNCTCPSHQTPPAGNRSPHRTSHPHHKDRIGFPRNRHRSPHRS